MGTRCAANGEFAKPTFKKKISRRRGAALYFAMLVLMVFSVVGLSLSNSSVQALRFTRMQEEQSAAFNLAESGAERAVLWLKQQDAPPSATSSFNPFGGAVALGTGTYNVTIDGDDINPNLDMKRYTIRCTGISGTRQETVQMFVQQSNFGRYAYFTDSETSALSGGAIWFKAGEVVDGPAHSNNADSPFNISWLGSTQSIFKAGLTSVANTINYSPTAPANETELAKVFSNGSKGYKLGVTRIDLPANTQRQKNAAWGSNTGFPTSNGIYVNTAGSVPLGGIYIKGDVEIEFKQEGNETQQVEITPVGSLKKLKIFVDRRNRQTIVENEGIIGSLLAGTSNGNKSTLSGLLNGVIYVEGNVTSLEGVLSDSHISGTEMVSRNAWTVATDIQSDKKVTITNDLKYRTAPDKTKAWNDPVNLKAATLGVVSRNIELAATAPKDLTLHGVMLAGGKDTTDGSFYNAGYVAKSPGVLTLLGGIIQKKRGPVGTFNSSTGTQSTGFSKNYSYDPRMAVNPPPFFPTTGGYDRLSWTRISGGRK